MTTNNYRNPTGLGSNRSMGGSPQDRGGQAPETRGYIAAPNAALVGGVLRGRLDSQAPTASTARGGVMRVTEQPQLVVAAIFDCRISKVRPVLQDRASWIDSDTGEAVHFVMLGHPCDSFAQGRLRLVSAGYTINSLSERWDEAARDRGEIETVLASETKLLVEHFKLDRTQVPCLVFQFLAGAAEAKFVVRIPGLVDASEFKARPAVDAMTLALKEAADGLADPEARAKGPGYAVDVVEDIATRLEKALRGIAGEPEPEQVGYVPTALEFEILEYLSTAGKRLVTREVAEELDRADGSIGEELANLTTRKLIDNLRAGPKGERGYGLTDLGRATLSNH